MLPLPAPRSLSAYFDAYSPIHIPPSHQRSPARPLARAPFGYPFSHLSPHRPIADFELVLQLATSDQPSTRLMISRNLPALAQVAIRATSPFARQGLCWKLLDSCVRLGDDEDEGV